MPHRGSRSAAFLNGKAAYGVFASGYTYRESALVLYAAERALQTDATGGLEQHRVTLS